MSSLKKLFTCTGEAATGIPHASVPDAEPATVDAPCRKSDFTCNEQSVKTV